METTNSLLAEAIVRRISDVMSLDGPPEDIDHRASVFGRDGFSLGEHDFDSLDLVEVLLTLEEDLEVQILDTEDIDRTESIEKLASLLAERADPDRLERFLREWAG